MARPANTSNYGYKVTTRTIDVQAMVREAEGAAWDMPYYTFEFGGRRFVQYNPYDWAINDVVPIVLPDITFDSTEVTFDSVDITWDQV